MNPETEYKFVPVDSHLRSFVIDLLRENNLPVSDLGEDKQLFALLQDGEVIGTGGLELLNNYALLRSISVRSDSRNKGLGTLITTALEAISKQKAIDWVYLLTTTAKEFFSRDGYEVINREDAPAAIKNTSEFSFICSSSSTLMRKCIS